MNISNVLYSMNEEVQAEKILYKLLENPVCVEDTSFYINTLLLLTEHDVPLSKNMFQKRIDCLPNLLIKDC